MARRARMAQPAMPARINIAAADKLGPQHAHGGDSYHEAGDQPDRERAETCPES